MDSSFNYNLVLLGRQLRKISQADLAKFASISQGHLSKIENGLAEPSEPTLKQIARILGFPQSFFNQPDRVYGLPISFHPMYRKKASIGQHILESIQAELNIRLIHLRRLIKSVSLKKQFPMPKVEIDEYDGDVEKVAELVRRTWLLPRGPLQNLTECVEQAGCLVIWCDFSGAPMDGVSYQIPDLPQCIFLNRNQPSDRMRFSLAHEIGHLVMHRIPTPEMEDQANKFASALLMPTADIHGSLTGRVSFPALAALKPVWRVSIQALIMKAYAVGTISSNQSRYLWQKINAGKLRYQEPPELDFPHEEMGILPAIFRTHIEDLGYSTEEIAEILTLNHYELIEMYPWLDGYKKTQLRLVS
jgi:Zn-dependent peptidase ImmA (M78 family)/transcriptional regulator with XRE-family HTH domain